MTDQVIKQIAAYAPLTKDELGQLGVLGDKKLEDYGDRLVRLVQKVVNEHNLQKYTGGGAASKPTTPSTNKKDARPSKRLKTFSSMSASKKEIVEMLEDDDDDDEFATDIDFDMIDLP